MKGTVGGTPFLDNAVCGDMVVSELGYRSEATPESTAVVGVGGTRDELLHAEAKENARLEGQVGLETLNGGKGTTGTTGTLVLDGRHHPGLTPIHSRRQFRHGIQRKGYLLHLFVQKHEPTK